MKLFDSFDPAIAHTKRVLFAPFDFMKWFLFGIIVFLECLATNGTGTGTGIGGGGGGDGGGNPDSQIDSEPFSLDWEQFSPWIIAAIGITVVCAILVLGLIVICQWIGSRFTMIFIESVANNEVTIGRSWTARSRNGNSLFLFKLCLMVVALLVLIVFGGIAAQVFFSAGKEAGDNILPIVFPVIVLGVLTLIFLIIVSILTRNFVAPLMYRFDLTALEGWRMFKPIMKSNLLSVFGFLLYKIVFGFMIGSGTILLGCVTCCIGFLPIINHTILAPAYVFDRSLTLLMIGTLGPEYQMIKPAQQKEAGEQ